MVTGLDKFKETFAAYKGKYTLIGGVACELLMGEAGLNFRATQDFDIVLIIEAMDKEFGALIWSFIKSGGYRIKEKSNGVPEFYRFKDPKDETYPKEIELFSRTHGMLESAEKDRLTSIHIADEISSLSAILLNDAYYDFLTSGLTEANGIQILNYTHMIPFKAKAWIDLNKRRASGESIDSKKVLKHKNDVFRLSQLIAETDRVDLNDEIKADMDTFVHAMLLEDVDLKNLNIRGNKNELLRLISDVYQLNGNTTV